MHSPKSQCIQAISDYRLEPSAYPSSTNARPYGLVCFLCFGLALSGGLFTFAGMAFAIEAAIQGEGLLPKKIIGILDCRARVNWEEDCTYKATRSRFLDLNDDGVDELFFEFGGGSCGRGFHIFAYDCSKGWFQLSYLCSIDVEEYDVVVLEEEYGGNHSIEIISRESAKRGDGRGVSSSDRFLYSVKEETYVSVLVRSDRVEIYMNEAPCSDHEIIQDIEVLGNNLVMKEFVMQLKGKAIAAGANAVKSVKLQPDPKAIVRFMTTLSLPGAYRATATAIQCR